MFTEESSHSLAMNDLCMAAGNGEHSYAANSRIANKAILQNMPLLQKAIQEVHTLSLLSPGSGSGSTMVVADLGCSSGPNTLLFVAEVMATISDVYNDRSTDKQQRALEVQFFLNDLPSNDFNLVFRMLDQFQNLDRKEETMPTTPPYYVAGLAGSFYRRLFPCNSVHVFHSSYSLQWLSKVPDELLSGSCINEGNIHIGRTSPHSVTKLFKEQFQMDFELFLTLRWKELVSGGRMLLTFLGRKSQEILTHGEIGTVWEFLAESLQSLVLKGRVEKERLDSFNLPLYAPSLDEVKAVLDRTELFAIEHMGPVEFNWDPQDDNLDDHQVPDPASSGRNVAKAIRAVLEPLITGHFGEDIIDELFAVYASIVAKHLEEAGNAKCGGIVVSMKKAMQ